MNNNQEQNWQPVRMLSMFVDMMNQQVEESKSQYENLLETKDKPYVLDDYTIKRVIKVFSEQDEFTTYYEKQFNKWLKEEKLSSAQKNSINESLEKLIEWRRVLKDILELSKELEKGTIDKVMVKNDFELGLDFFEKFTDK